ncbi:MAG: hypothetical protein OIF47_01235 [Marinibacterium sp.]|nr:hypothetical protein [Marinibacterium sp.]
MKALISGVALAAMMALPLAAKGLVDKGFASGWNIMMDPQMGNGCLIQTIYEDQSVVRIGYDALNNRGYFVVIDKDWGNAVKKGEAYPVTFDLDGEMFDATAEGMRIEHVPGAIVFFDDPKFLDAIAAKKHMTVFGTQGHVVMKIDLAGTADALKHARDCQASAG